MPTAIKDYAREFYSRLPAQRVCQVCGLDYVKDLPQYERLHRSFHREVLETFDPKPNAALAKQHAQFGTFVPINTCSPAWMHKRMFRIARNLTREAGYKFTMWGMKADHGQGF